MASYNEHQMLADKESFFERLQALQENSDEEDNKNEVREIIRQCKKPSGLAVPPVVAQELVTTSPLKKISAFRRDTSPPTSINSSLAQEDPSAPTTTNARPQERQLVPEYPIGADLILKHSTGVEFMLKKKVQKQKESNEASIELIPQNERIFKDLTFYYVPPDAKSLSQTFWMQKAREHGVTWAKDWNTESITHVVVNNGLSYESVITFLKIDTWPPNILLVNENYPIDCAQHKLILNPKQSRYEVPGQDKSAAEEVPPELALKTSDHRGLALNGNSARRQLSTQLCLARDTLPQMAANTSQGSCQGCVESPLENSFSENKPRKRPKISSPGDLLDEMIIVARDIQHLPINDKEDEEISRSSSRDDISDSDSEEEIRHVRARKSLKIKKSGAYSSGNQKSFFCMTGGSGMTSENNPNVRTIEVLQEMADYCVRIKDHWRQIAYRKAISTLKRQTIKISTYEQAIILPAIGHRLALKIEEIVATNRLRRLENAKLEINDRILDTFMKIYGVGVNQAWKWVQQGHKTLQDLLDHAYLTKNQKLGIERYDDFLTRIPRDEVTALGKIIKNTSTKIDPLVEVIIGGSYRRGASTCGDIDCVLTKPGTKTSRDLLPFINELVSQLTASGFLVAALAVPSEAGSASKWHGCCVLPGVEKPIWRRIDLLMVPATELGAALIYFTGDDVFNRSMRLLSSKKGWRLNQRGLFKNVMRGPGRVRVNDGELMEGADEKRIFELLGVPWRAPEDRICR